MIRDLLEFATPALALLVFVAQVIHERRHRKHERTVLAMLNGKHERKDRP